MAYNKNYEPIGFMDYPETTTPLSSSNLNYMDEQIKGVTGILGDNADLSGIGNTVCAAIKAINSADKTKKVTATGNASTGNIGIATGNVETITATTASGTKVQLEASEKAIEFKEYDGSTWRTRLKFEKPEFLLTGTVGLSPLQTLTKTYKFNKTYKSPFVTVMILNREVDVDYGIESTSDNSVTIKYKNKSNFSRACAVIIKVEEM